MNIFILDLDPGKAAEYHCDKHVVKMVLETAQMLSTISGGPYKATHAAHPCTKWAAETNMNYRWLVRLGQALAAEYTFRYGKVHKCIEVIEALRSPPPAIPGGTLTPFALAMPEEFKCNNPVTAYREYYRATKAHLGVWTKRPTPDFMKGALPCVNIQS